MTRTYLNTNPRAAQVEIWTVALAVTSAEVSEDLKTAAAVCDDVRGIIQKACPQLPSSKKLKALDLDEEEALCVASDGDPDAPFDPADSAVFAELLLLSEHDCDMCVEACIEALEAKSYTAAVIDLEDGAFMACMAWLWATLQRRGRATLRNIAPLSLSDAPTPVYTRVRHPSEEDQDYMEDDEGDDK
jgi:hypothetical protein